MPILITGRNKSEYTYKVMSDKTFIKIDNIAGIKEF